MKAEKIITPILLIVVSFVALMATFAWFASKTTQTVKGVIKSGDVTSFSIAAGNEYMDGDCIKYPTPYEGQKGYDSNGNIYTTSDKPYEMKYNLSFVMKSSSDCVMKISIAKVIVNLTDKYPYTLAQTIENVLGVSGITESDYTKYYSSSVDSLPTGEGASPFYCVYNEKTQKVTSIVITGVYVDRYFCFDYWKSAEEMIERGDTDSGYVSALSSGMNYKYGVDVSASGITNYIGLYIGFYGHNQERSTYSEEFRFSDQTTFLNSSFKFIFSVG